MTCRLPKKVAADVSRRTPSALPQDVFGLSSHSHAPKPGCNRLQCAAVGSVVPGQTLISTPGIAIGSVFSFFAPSEVAS